MWPLLIKSLDSSTWTEKLLFISLLLKASSASCDILSTCQLMIFYESGIFSIFHATSWSRTYSHNCPKDFIIYAILLFWAITSFWTFTLSCFFFLSYILFGDFNTCLKQSASLLLKCCAIWRSSFPAWPETLQRQSSSLCETQW